NELDLSGTKIDDEGVALLLELPALETLWLTQTKVSDASLPGLEKMKSLKFLQVDNSQITSEGWRAFLQKRPDLATPPP
ncbi:MAG: hypothetical protein J0M26_08725, partial [Planctomycetes bacterium]|nr:hypothetical protein [Planctomycetota bacterium]